MKRINETVLLRPWAMKQDSLVLMSQILERHLRGEKLTAVEIEGKLAGSKKDIPSYEMIGATARIPIYGVISKRATLFSKLSSGGTSVDEIKNELITAIDDPNVKSILLDIDSPGGSVGGVAELADYIFASRGKKPIIAYANGQMASAAYWLGSSAERIYGSVSAEVGSIGVYTILQDYSVMDHNQGIKTHVIKAGKFKAAGNESKPLTEDERAIIQDEINTYYDLFIGAVARNRNISREQVLELADGRVWIGQKAEDAGLVDGIRTLEEMMSSPSSSQRSKPNAAADSGSVEIKDQLLKQVSRETKEEHQMNTELTVEKLKADHKPLVEALIAEGRAAGVVEGMEKANAEAKNALETSVKESVGKETARCAEIVSSMPAGARALAVEAIKSGLSTEAAKTSFLNAVNSGAPQSVGPNADLEADGTKTRSKKDATGEAHLKEAREYQKLNKCTLAEALKATASVRDQ